MKKDNDRLHTENGAIFTFRKKIITDIYLTKRNKEMIEKIVFGIYEELKGQNYISEQDGDTEYYNSRLRRSIHNILANKFAINDKNKKNNSTSAIKLDETMKNHYAKEICNHDEQKYKEKCIDKVYKTINKYVSKYEESAKIILNSVEYYSNHQTKAYQRSKETVDYNKEIRQKAGLRLKVNNQNEIGITKIIRSKGKSKS